MKTNWFKAIVVLMIITVFSGQVYAQNRGGRGKCKNGKQTSECRYKGDTSMNMNNCRIPDLTVEQQKAMKKSRLAFQKEAIVLKNQPLQRILKMLKWLLLKRQRPQSSSHSMWLKDHSP